MSNYNYLKNEEVLFVFYRPFIGIKYELFADQYV